MAYENEARAPANGEITGASIYRIRDGLIAFEQDYVNQPRSD